MIHSLLLTSPIGTLTLTKAQKVFIVNLHIKHPYITKWTENLCLNHIPNKILHLRSTHHHQCPNRWNNVLCIIYGKSHKPWQVLYHMSLQHLQKWYVVVSYGKRGLLHMIVNSCSFTKKCSSIYIHIIGYIKHFLVYIYS